MGHTAATEPSASRGAIARVVRAVGRPRNPRCEEAILQATRELLAEEGVRTLTVEGVAARAGVAKTTIYRRWRSRHELAMAVLVDMVATMMPVADLGDARTELVALLRATVTTLRESLMGRVMQGLVSELAVNAELAAAFRRDVVAARRAEVLRVLERGIARGEIRPDADLDLAPELLVGPVYYRLLLSGAPLEPDLPERIVAALLPGFATTP